MENLDALLFPDWIAIVAGIASGNIITLGVLVLVGLSPVPEMGLLGVAGSFILVVAGFTILPAIAVLILIFTAS